MTREAFSVMQDLLRNAGLPIGEVRSAEVFGSWFISLRTDPPLRISWDGRDECLILRRARPQRLWEFLLALLNYQWVRGPVWEEVWIGRDEEARRPEAVLAQVQRLLCHPGPADPDPPLRSPDVGS